MSKRLLCLLLSAVMILGMMPGMLVSAEETNEEAFAFVGKGDTTGGDWVGKYGADGYFLPFYTIYEKYNPLVNAENPEFKIEGGRYRPGTRYTLEDGVSLKNLPSYVSRISEIATGDGYSLDDSKGYFMPGSEPLAPQDPREGATTRNKAYVRSASYMAYKFTLSDNEWHDVTVYATSYNFKSSATYAVIEGTNEGGTAAASYTATEEETKAGVYMTFRVKGNFVLRVDKVSGDTALINGIFFDAVPTAGDGEDGDEPSAPTAYKVGVDKTTGGAWQNVYGKEAAILYGYKNPITPEEVAVAVKDRITRTENNDTLVVKPENSSLDKTYCTLGGNNVRCLAPYVCGTDGVLDLPDGVTGQKYLMQALGRWEKGGAGFVDGTDGYEAYGSNTRQGTHTLEMKDTAQHTISLYAYTTYTNPLYVTIQNLDGEVLLKDAIQPGTFDNGAYVSYVVPGSVKIILDQSSSGDYSVGISGIFVDPVDSSDPTPDPDPVDPPAAETMPFVSNGVMTGGDWIGKVGSEGYFLPFYTIFGAYGEIASGRYDKNTTECTGWSLQDKSSLMVLGEGIAITGEEGTNNGYYIGDKDFRVTTDGRALQDPRDGATTRNMTYVRSNPWLAYSFNMPEDEAYYVTLYTTDYAGGLSSDCKLMIMNPAGTEVLGERVVTIEDLGKGVYTTFKVTGDFKLKLQGTSYVFLSGVFFDKAPEWEISDFAVASGESLRSAVLSWSCDEAVAIERKASGSVAWERIAVVEAGIGTYTDSNLNAATTYTYRLAATNKVLFGAYTEEKNITTPDYARTVLTTEQQSYTVTVGQTMQIRGQMKKADDTALADKEIHLTLTGSLVDEGFVNSSYGVVTTGTDGTFSVAVFDLPVGSYELNLQFMADDENMLAQSSAVVSLEIVPVAWEAAPMAMSVSDGVAPGEYFSINGYGFNIGTPEVRIGTGSVDSATALTIAQYDVVDGYFIQLQLPETMAAGTYKLWVKNDNGWSEPILLNAARPLFISENSAWAGQIIEISGRNLLGSQYGAADATAVRLVGTAGTYTQTVVENNPYKIAFAVKDAPVGDYTVEVTNDGANWAPLSSGQILTVVAEGKDPLGLGVAWADVYKWDNQISVLDHGATGDDTTDDTAAIQAAIDAAAVDGGVVYLPAGSYYVTKLNVPAHVVILGEGMDKTFLYYNGTDGLNMIESAGTGMNVGYQGFAKFTIRLADVNYQPDTYFWLGYAWGGDTLNNKYTRENKYYFMYEVAIDADPVIEGSNRGLGVVPIVGEHFLLQSCRFVGDMAIPTSGYVTAYASMKDCYLEFAQGIPQLNSSYTFIEDTDVIIHYETGRDSHGIVVRDNSHVEDCYVYGAGSGKSNDGETILAEATSFFDYGSVVSVDGNKILLNGTLTTLSGFKLRWGDLTIMITDGKGIGQYRKVDMSKFNWSNPNATEFYVTEPWDIEPDGTSKYTLVCMIENVTFYRNKTEDGVKGMWFYGNVIDGVIAGNTSIDTEGIFVYSCESRSKSRHQVSYSNTVRDNELYGVARQSNRVGIYTHTQRHNGQAEYVAMSIYALDVKNNRIYGDATKTPVSMNETPRHSGIVISSCEISSDPNCLSELGQADLTNVIVQGNQLFNLKEGILVTSCTYGTVIANNYFEDVETKLVKLAVDTAKEAEPLMLLSDITDEPQTQPECEDHLWLEGDNCLECGWCGEKKAAQIGQTVYASLEEALSAAEVGETVQLLVDIETDQVIVANGATLDLNGYELTADYLVAFSGSQVMDSVGTGLLKCGKVRLEKNNEQMPVWVEAEGGYRFFEMKSQQKYSAQTENGFVFIAKPVLASHANDIFLAQSQTNGLTIKVRLNWTSNSGKAVEQFFILDAADMATIYSDENKVIQLNVTGAGAYANKLYTTCYIESETGVIWAPNGRLYTGE